MISQVAIEANSFQLFIKPGSIQYMPDVRLNIHTRTTHTNMNLGIITDHF
jgi:hypothetical protein